jgi:hypothetical protein
MSGELRQIELSSPVLTLVALYWVANNRPEWTGMDGKTMIATGFGIASADYIRDKVKEFRLHKGQGKGVRSRVRKDPR